MPSGDELGNFMLPFGLRTMRLALAFLLMVLAHDATALEGRVVTWDVRTEFGFKYISGALVIQIDGAPYTFPVTKGIAKITLPTPKTTQLRDYQLRRFVLKSALIIPMFRQGQERPEFQYSNGGPMTRRQVALSSAPLESSEGMVGSSGQSVHYFVYTTTAQIYQASYPFTDVNVELQPGWNFVSCSSDFILGTKIRATRKPPRSLRLREVPADYWSPIVKVL
jgi:hypothetical protein